MKITFGLGLDGNVWLPSLLEKAASVGECAVGPMGMLRILGTITGSTVPEVHHVQRMLAYLHALKKADSASRFFHESLQTDELGVANHLLGVRDELVMAGWQGKDLAAAARLKDLAAVEALLENAEGPADQLKAALNTLQSLPALPIQAVSLMDPLEHFPKLWRDLIELLRIKGVDVSQTPLHSEKRTGSSDLRNVQNLTQAGKGSKDKGDGSFRLLVGQDPWQAARWTAAWLQEQKGTTVVVAPERYRRILAASFAERGLPFGGEGGANSVARPSVQILLLSLSLAWGPKNPGHALAFLMLPVSPIPGKMRYRLTSALHEAPAIGSEDWNLAIQKALSEIEEADGEEKAKNAAERVASFFGGKEFPRGEGLPAKEIFSICARVSKWARGYGEFKNQASYKEAASLADAVAAAAIDSGIEILSYETFSRLVSDVLGDGIKAQVEPARSGGAFIVSRPEAVLGNADNMIWWDFSRGAASGVRSSFWTRNERKLFRKDKLELPEPMELAISNAKGWVRPILAAQDNLLAVSFEADISHEPEGPHPILDQMIPPQSDMQKEWLAAIQVKPGVGLDSATNEFEKLVGAAAIKASPPPWKAHEHWSAPKKALALREEESPSAMGTALGCLLAYSLHYGARLRSGATEELPDGNLLYGKIAHKVFEETFKVGIKLTPQEAKEKATAVLKDLFPKYAAQLLSPDRRNDRIYVETNIIAAAFAYGSFLQDNGYEILRVEEKKYSDLLGDTKLAGTPDHVLGIKGIARLIMDHKWSGQQYKAADLKAGEALQLAMYAHLEQHKEGYPDVGYFIIDDQKPLILGLNLKGAENITGPTMKEVYNAKLEQITEKVAQLKTGTIQAAGLADDPNAAKEAGCNFCGFSAICGSRWKGTL